MKLITLLQKLRENPVVRLFHNRFEDPFFEGNMEEAMEISTEDLSREVNDIFICEFAVDIYLR